MCQCPIAGFIISTTDFLRNMLTEDGVCQCPIAGFIISTIYILGHEFPRYGCQCYETKYGVPQDASKSGI